MSKAPVIPSRGGNRGGQLMLVGFVLFFVSWFVPVYSGQETVANLTNLVKGIGVPGAAFKNIDAPDWLPGWGACKFAWNVLIEERVKIGDGTARADEPWKQRLAGSSCLTNGVMLIGIVLLTARRRVLVGLLLLGCAGVNASWIYLLDQNPFDVYRAGYFLWLASFAHRRMPEGHTPEQLARQAIDAQLRAAGWLIQDRATAEAANPRPKSDVDSA
jgi:hypothetical protein